MRSHNQRTSYFENQSDPSSFINDNQYEFLYNNNIDSQI